MLLTFVAAIVHQRGSQQQQQEQQQEQQHQQHQQHQHHLQQASGGTLSFFFF
jgi:hypothetical protein